MKKIVASVLALVMALSLAACGNKNTPNTQGSASSVGGDTAPLKVALVVNQPFGDKGSMDDLADGADRAAADFGVDVYKLESSTTSFEDDIRAMCQQGYNLIVTTFGYMQDATIAVSRNTPM